MIRHRNPAFLRSWWLAGPLCLLAVNASAAIIQVFTDRDHPVHGATGIQVVELDAPTALETGLSFRLPTDPTRAAAIARARLNTGGAPLQRRLAVAYQDVVYAWSLGIEKIPAVVVDRRYVVYGVPNVARAVSIIDRYKRKHP
ncbi:MAG TPA: TIGR03757 family integrating conjugative element protein [Steroidobacteraceae bacterium]|nr:TIGR03757 family integrating conjugative element protein [Steroidobacteraceae bacterium]